MGFEINTYITYIANKVVNGTDMIITWHEDDLKVSHILKIELTRFILKMAKLYGASMTVSRERFMTTLVWK